jgi:hypothetical protein
MTTATRTTSAPKPVAGDSRPTKQSIVPACIRDLRNLARTIFNRAQERAEVLDRDGGQVTYQVLRGSVLDDDPHRDPQRDPLSSRRADLVDLANDPEACEALRLLKSVARRHFGIVWR